MLKTMRSPRFLACSLMMIVFFCASNAFTYAKDREGKREKESKELQKRFEWWPTDAKPAPVKDPAMGGYWWMPTEPGTARPWGNRGYIYVYKIIFDYKEEELPPPKPQEPRAALLIKKIIKNVKIYFDYDKSELRDDAVDILENAVRVLGRNPDASVLITGNCDLRGSEAYNEKLGRRRGEAVRRFMLDNGIPEERIRIVSRGKLDAIAHVDDLVGMQKDRNAQFTIAEVKEVMIPYGGEGEQAAAEAEDISQAQEIEDGKYLIEKEQEVTSEVRISTKEYRVKKGDTLSSIAKEQLGKAHRWKYLYELNKDRIKDPNKLKAGQEIVIPVE
ncbi:MAG: OmpA family protein [Candidatus Omnitrophica bacterium]|nr:OmpA family protein [Candidatus Omnitrophota bacterium]